MSSFSSGYLSWGGGGGGGRGKENVGWGGGGAMRGEGVKTDLKKYQAKYFQVSSCSQHRLDGSHAIVIMMLGGELL